MHTLSCIKCSAKYQSTDPDPYYCDPCNEARKALAAEIDKKVAGSKRESVSDLQQYNALPKVRGFVSAKDLGLL